MEYIPRIEEKNQLTESIEQIVKEYLNGIGVDEILGYQDYNDKLIKLVDKMQAAGFDSAYAWRILDEGYDLVLIPEEGEH